MAPSHMAQCKGDFGVGRWADCEDSDESDSTQAVTTSDFESLWPESETSGPFSAGLEDLTLCDMQLEELLHLHRRSNQKAPQQTRELKRELQTKAELFHDLSQRNSASHALLSELGSVDFGLLQATAAKRFAEGLAPLTEVRTTWTQLRQAKQRQTQLVSKNAQLQSLLERLLADDVDESLLAQTKSLLGAMEGAPWQPAEAECFVKQTQAAQQTQGRKRTQRRKTQLASESAQLQSTPEKLLADTIFAQTKALGATAPGALWQQSLLTAETGLAEAGVRKALDELQAELHKAQLKDAVSERMLRTLVTDGSFALHEDLGNGIVPDPARKVRAAATRDCSAELLLEAQALRRPLSVFEDEVIPVARRPACRTVRWELCD